MNLSRSFLALKKVSPIGICRLLKDLSLKKWESPRARMESESIANEAEG